MPKKTGSRTADMAMDRMTRLIEFLVRRELKIDISGNKNGSCKAPVSVRL